ncbi:hypothetical protein GWI33_011936 [Rhynchophorus ferrugineus]|uniref:Uncharacterized protein n=1 Tax=Rhynchophorus ferrugineus TaxID=354439 RepID=A0A834IWE2_RHYFE|nr:hypothetical protein GWI33_011936 [Rhynchophorus ferrugineus]
MISISFYTLRKKQFCSEENFISNIRFENASITDTIQRNAEMRTFQHQEKGGLVVDDDEEDDNDVDQAEDEEDDVEKEE